MEPQVVITLTPSEERELLRFPQGLDDRLQFLLDKNNDELLTDAELLEAEGLVDVANVISILRMKAELARRQAAFSHPQKLQIDALNPTAA